MYNDGVDFKVCLPHEAEIYELIFDTLMINSSVVQSALSLQWVDKVGCFQHTFLHWPTAITALYLTHSVIVLPKWMKVILRKITPGLWYFPSLKSDTWCWWEKPTNPTKSTDGWREQLVGQSCCSHCGNKNAASVQLFFLPPAFMKKFRKKKGGKKRTDQRLKTKTRLYFITKCSGCLLMAAA